MTILTQGSRSFRTVQAGLVLVRCAIPFLNAWNLLYDEIRRWPTAHLWNIHNSNGYFGPHIESFTGIYGSSQPNESNETVIYLDAPYRAIRIFLRMLEKGTLSSQSTYEQCCQALRFCVQSNCKIVANQLLEMATHSTRDLEGSQLFHALVWASNLCNARAAQNILEQGIKAEALWEKGNKDVFRLRPSVHFTSKNIYSTWRISTEWSRRVRQEWITALSDAEKESSVGEYCEQKMSHYYNNPLHLQTERRYWEKLAAEFVRRLDA
ncbi:hypothetical protein IFR05_002033 [Cadophora sp. M221]|nr:hypothetical protein IFR05_002033 [Cadophora sp. M221]